MRAILSVTECMACDEESDRERDEKELLTDKSDLSHG